MMSQKGNTNLCCLHCGKYLAGNPLAWKTAFGLVCGRGCFVRYFDPPCIAYLPPPPPAWYAGTKERVDVAKEMREYYQEQNAPVGAEINLHT